MAPPKRALFSLNLDTDADHVYQKVEDHSKDGTDRVKVIESKGPTHGHTDLSYVTKPFEKTVNRAVNEVIEGSGRKRVTYRIRQTERNDEVVEQETKTKKKNAIEAA
ncbi:uncharacterized protein J4E92_005748 [Alternaria infectoria]|uniref:uncharacterized protein n=1 Tax=Alternaria conjuncta TaxID=181017 RepID=UPI00222017EB|nr:uncharacterized protein J4E85_004715 [Alternaria conjuncta]XP_051352786.1 uncharacterized protein J4E92_005748 [Alternaria infectoria]KAI4928264.1 hypothetical protein J4E92_005748 [Alternaria infectoria]KAI4930091.1 hypothetical protein J4E85_004715 [Alternaria conjuncta]